MTVWLLQVMTTSITSGVRLGQNRRPSAKISIFKTYSQWILLGNETSSLIAICVRVGLHCQTFCFKWHTLCIFICCKKVWKCWPCCVIFVFKIHMFNSSLDLNELYWKKALRSSQIMPTSITTSIREGRHIFVHFILVAFQCQFTSHKQVWKVMNYSELSEIIVYIFVQQ